MSTKYPGGFITKNYTAPTPTSAPGIWTLEQQEQAQQAGIWPFGGPFNYIEDVFSTYIYTGNGSTQTITNGIDLSTKGGMTWIKCRTNAYDHEIFDTVRGINKYIIPNKTVAQDAYGSYTDLLTSFDTTGFTLGADASNIGINRAGSGQTYASWTFRKQPKFFDVVTYTGNGSAPRAISHSLGSTPGCIIIKKTSGTGNWWTFHRSAPNQGVAYPNIGGNLYLDTTDAADSGANPFLSAVDSTTFTLSTNQNTAMNANGATYVAYIFAHNAGGFGTSNTDNVISCGSFTTDGSGNANVNLGYEPQWVLIKNSSAAGYPWYMFDNMRGLTVGGNDAMLQANTSNAEANNNIVEPSATGFSFGPGATSNTYIYIAIRRGPMKVPTDATKVFFPNTVSSDASAQTTNFPVDMFLTNKRAGDALNTIAVSKLTSNSGLVTSSTAAEAANYASATWWQSNTSYTAGVWGTASIVDYAFRRAPSFFDEVCYTGTGSATTFNHNLGVIPELMIVKERDVIGAWRVYSKSIANTDYLVLNSDGVVTTGDMWNSTNPTSTVFSVGTNYSVNRPAGTFVNYLFATCAGVSKVGSYTGTGATQTIACGFTGGARFVLVKRTDSTGDWYVWDSARGMVAGTDPSLLLNSTAAEVNANSVYTTTGGFQIVSTAAGINASGGSYIFLAIA
jgi:hypothetical protein